MYQNGITEGRANALFRTKKILDDNPSLKKQWLSLIPQGKMGVPEDLMGPVAFLSSDAARYVTGAVSYFFQACEYCYTDIISRICVLMAVTP